MHPMLNIAVRAIRSAGKLLTRQFGLLNGSTCIDLNKLNSIQMAENVLAANIRKSYPGHKIFSENGEKLSSPDNEIRWIINPLDSRENFLRHIPHFCTSIAVQVCQRTEIAVVYDPIKDELFTATRGQGARLNNYRLRNKNKCIASDIRLATNFFLQKNLCYKSRLKSNNIEKLVNSKVQIYSMGSASLDLSYVAANRFDGYLAFNILHSDSIAGELIAREAGFLLKDKIYKNNKDIMLGSDRLIRSLSNLIQI